MIGLHFIQIVLLLLSLQTDFSNAASSEGHNIVRRETTCEKRFKDNYGESHSACLAPSVDAKNTGVSEANKKIILDTHNHHRSIVSPKASNMIKMSWDDDIAKIAQGWTSTCPTGHDKRDQRKDWERYGSCGQNYGRGYSNWESAINGWASEKADYDYATNTGINNKTVGHYTQVVWADSFKIGCGYAECGEQKIFTCNYGPGGNYAGEKPYKTGDSNESCGECKKSCSDNLCDCKGMDCYDKEKRSFNRDACTCTCLHNLVAPNCTVDCPNHKDAEYCANWEDSCVMHYKYICATKCKLCTET